LIYRGHLSWTTLISGTVFVSFLQYLCQFASLRLYCHVPFYTYSVSSSTLLIVISTILHIKVIT
jgi:hypothetical protein